MKDHEQPNDDRILAHPLRWAFNWFPAYRATGARITAVISLEPIGYVHSPRHDTADDPWGDVTATIELDASFDAASLDGIDQFSHAEIIFHFDRVPPAGVERGTRHPRGNTAWPRVGIFAQRGSARPNRLGATVVEIVGRSGRVLTVRGLDAIDGTPVLDIKPVMLEFLPRSPVHQPQWSRQLMRDYWKATSEGDGAA